MGTRGGRSPDYASRTTRRTLAPALRVNDLLRDAGPGGPEDHGLWGAFTQAKWQFSRERSKAVVEAALETLVYDGLAEKRALEHDGEITIYYRATESEDQP